MRGTWRTWATLPVVATWLIVLLFCGYVAADLAISRGQAQRQAEELATSYVRLVEEHASSTFDRGNLVLSRAVALVTAEDAAAARSMAQPRRDAIQDGLKALQRENRSVVSMTVTDSEGYAFANTVGVPPGSTLADREYFLRLKAQNSEAPVISEVIYGRLSKRWGVQIARRIKAADGSFAGMIVANLGLSENFTDFYAGLSLPAGSIVLLKDLRHLVIVRYPVREELFGKPIPANEITEWLGRNVTEQAYDSVSPVDGKLRLNAFRKLSNYPLYVIVGMSQETYLANWRASRTRGLMAVALALAGAVIGTALLRRKEELHKALQVSEENARALLDATTDACMLFRLDGTLLGCNAVMAERFGRPPQELLGANLWQLFPPDVAEQRRRTVADAVAAAHPVTLQDRRHGRHLSNNIYPIADAGGHIDRVAVFSRDITRETEAEACNRDVLQEIERSNADLERFAYIASHDLREPLRMVASYVALLERRYAQQLDDDARQFIAYAADGAKRMDRLILDLLDYSRLKRWGDAMVPTPAGEAVALALANLCAAVEESGVSVTVGDMPMVVADPSQLTRLFQNLIGNALKYRADDRAPEVRVAAQPIGDAWEFSVGDNGIGIDPQFHEHIFGIFQRLHTRQKYDGTGIGLAVCRSIVERHGGRIWVSSTPGQGTTFHFTLKAVAGSAEPDTAQLSSSMVQ